MGSGSRGKRKVSSVEDTMKHFVAFALRWDGKECIIHNALLPLTFKEHNVAG